MNLRLFFVILFICFIFFNVTLDQIVIRVNDDVVSQSRYDKFMNYMQKISPGIDSEQLISYLVSGLILFQLSRDYGIFVTDDELRSDFNKLKNSNFSYFEKVKNYSEELLFYELRKKKLKEKFLQFIVTNNYIKIPDFDDIKKYYLDNNAMFIENDKVELGHILFNLSGDDIDMIQFKEDLASSVLLMIESGKMSFKSLAKKYSEDLSSKKKGGVLGWFDFDTLSKLSQEYADKAFQMDINKTSDIIYTDKGISIIYVFDKKPSQKKSFKESYNFINQRIIYDRALNYFNAMIDFKKSQSLIFY